MRCDVVVVGAGLAGLSAAQGPGRRGHRRGRARGARPRRRAGRADAASRRAAGAARRRARRLLPQRLPRAGRRARADDHPRVRRRDHGRGGRAARRGARGRHPLALVQRRRPRQLRGGGGASSRSSPRGVDPDDPWSHPEAERLDRISVGAWMRSVGATPNAVRARELGALALSAESVERTSLLSDLRKEAAAGGQGFYDYAVWEAGMVEEGSATRRAADGRRAHDRIHYSTPATAIRIASGGCAVETATGERFECEAVVSAVPVGPLRRIAIDGVSAERLASLDRQRHALAAKVVLLLPGLVLGARRPQRHRLHGDDDDRRHLAPAAGDHVDAGPARAPGRLPHHLAAAARGRAHRRDGRCVRRARRASRSRSTSAAGASTRGPWATSPAGAPAT